MIKTQDSNVISYLYLHSDNTCVSWEILSSSHIETPTPTPWPSCAAQPLHGSYELLNQYFVVIHNFLSIIHANVCVFYLIVLLTIKSNFLKVLKDRKFNQHNGCSNARTLSILNLLSSSLIYAPFPGNMSLIKLWQGGDCAYSEINREGQEGDKPFHCNIGIYVAVVFLQHLAKGVVQTENNC